MEVQADRKLTLTHECICRDARIYLFLKASIPLALFTFFLTPFLLSLIAALDGSESLIWTLFLPLEIVPLLFTLPTVGKWIRVKQKKYVIVQDMLLDADKYGRRQRDPCPYYLSFRHYGKYQLRYPPCNRWADLAVEDTCYLVGYLRKSGRFCLLYVYNTRDYEMNGGAL
ncbi:MAG: hypothetical protein J6R04_03270 [Clostridia bacterium]|nr:hypothetical protein [Clostridia bacterium]